MMRVGVDVGGTFTDFVFVHDDGSVTHHKVPSTPDDPSRAILLGLGAKGDLTAELLVHGSTVATNAVLERKGARTALVTTRGFGDVFFIGRQVRPSLYDLDASAPLPLIDPAHVVEVDNPVDVALLRDTVAALGVESIAIVLLDSFNDNAAEESLAEVLAPLGLPVSLSSRVVREYREYERASTTVVNATVAPVMERYIACLEERLGEILGARDLAPPEERSHQTSRAPDGAFRIMQSNGGQMPPNDARRLPVHTILSGPAGGVVGAAHVGRAAGVTRFVSFDMGGTSTDVALVDDGFVVTSEGSIEGFPLRVPMIDIHTVGAGGGSIAAFDGGGALTVGPHSAGAQPGPACYDRGGTHFTVTDANLALGRLSPAHFLGGEMHLNEIAAMRAADSLAAPLGMRGEDVASAVVAVVNSNMERAIRVISVERGHDVRDFTLLCFGGAGGLHAADLATALGISRVVVPCSPGTLSAYGVLNADVIKDRSRTVLGHEETLPHVMAELERDARTVLDADRVEGERVVSRTVDLRYAGQSFEIPVPYSEDMVDDFHRAHQRRFGHCNPDGRVEIVHARVRVSVPTPPVVPPVLPATDRPVVPVLTRRAWCGPGFGWRDAAVIDRSSLRAGHEFQGPAVVVELSATTWVPPGAYVRVDDHGNLCIDVTGLTPEDPWSAAVHIGWDVAAAP